MNSRFSKRLLFGTLLVVLIGGGLMLDAARGETGGRPLFAPLLATLFTLASVRELLALLSLGGCPLPRAPFLGAAALLLLGRAHLAFHQVERAGAWNDALFATVVVALSALLLIDRDVASGARRAGAAALVLLFTQLCATWIDIVYVLGSGPLFALVLGAKAGDIGAYLAGKSLGRRKLIPHISPGKTIEGAVGGLAAALLVTAWLLGHFAPGRFSPGERLAVGALLFVAGHVGDLIESLWKRAAGVKDSGRLLPEFGGALDLVDSLFLSVPAGYALLRLLDG